MDATQAAHFHDNLLPIMRDAAEDDASDPRDERNPLRKMLKMLLGYVEYLESMVPKGDG